MPWHESQLIGVAVGGLLVFFTSRFLERKGEKKRLTAGIKTEIMTRTRFLRVGLKQLENYLDQLETTGTLKQRFRSTGAFTTPFLDANLDKLTLLDTTLSGKLIAYRGLTGVLGNAIRITEEIILAASQRNLLHDAVKKRMAIAANAWRKPLTVGDEIIELVR